MEVIDYNNEIAELLARDNVYNDEVCAGIDELNIFKFIIKKER